jgi:tetratricopeptide (TPR) repeat protein
MASTAGESVMPRPVLPLALLAVVFAAGPVAAQADPEPKTPYLWRVVLKAQPHPLLSTAFREQLKRDLVAALQPALGNLGTVEVIDLAEVPHDLWDPLWQQFDDKGFDALAAPRDLTGVKTHFLTIEYRDGQYHLQSRQHDGFTGLASPVVRKQSVRAPELVGRTAGLLLDRDFGLAGTVEATAGKTDEVKVTVRGGQLGPAERFVKEGDIFAIAEVRKTNRPAPPPARTATGKVIAPPPGTAPPPGLSSRARAYTLLRVTEVGKDGTLKAAPLSVYKNPIPGGGGVVAYRCLRLGTVEGPLTVRLVSADPASQKALGLVSVRATEAGFGSAEGKDTLEFRDGLFRSARPLANVACITVSIGPSESKLFAVPVLGPEPVALPFEINPKAEERANFERAALGVAVRVSDANLAQTICFEETAKLIDKQKNSQALARAKGGLTSADAEDKAIADELARLKEQAAASPDSARLLAIIEQRLVALRNHNVELAEHIKKLEVVVARENDPATAAKQVQADALATQINILLSRGDVDEAITAYGQLITLLPDNPEVKAKRDKLKAEWTPKSDAHAKARDYLLKTWPAVATIPDFKDSLPQIGAAVDECIKNGDQYTLRKLLFHFNGAGRKLHDLVEPLDASADADRKLAADAKQVGETMAALENKITEFLKGKKD